MTSIAAAALAAPDAVPYVAAAFDPIALFLIAGAGLMFAALIYAILIPDRSSDDSENAADEDRDRRK